MSEIHNLKELNSLRRDLKSQDIVIFYVKDKEILEYKVECSYLNGTNCYNDHIFDLLGFSREEKYKFADKCYGYNRSGGVWPYFKSGDYEAATRLVRRLYELIEGVEPKKVVKKEITRFDLMDLD